MCNYLFARIPKRVRNNEKPNNLAEFISASVLKLYNLKIL